MRINITTHQSIYLPSLLKAILLLILCQTPRILDAQSIPELPSKTTIQLTSQQEDETIITFISGGIVLEKPHTGKSEFCPRLDQGTPILRKGYPDMDKLTTSLIIPADKEMVVEVISSRYEEINISILPSKGSISRQKDPSTISREKARIYKENAFFPSSPAMLGQPYILRDHCGQTITAYPFQYNPVTGILRIYTEITVRIKPSGKQIPNRLAQKRSNTAIPIDFKNIYQRHFINHTHASRYTPLEEDGNMLIISYGPFIPEMQAYIQWKREKGIPVEIVNVATIGDAEEIRSFVKNYYNSKGLTWLLLVGDHQQVPSYLAPIGWSDNFYGYISGDDHYPEVFVGRFSGENGSHIKTQVDRTINYEKYPDPSAAWYKNTLGIASSEGPGDDWEFDFQHIRNIRAQLMNYTYTLGDELYDGDQGGQDSLGSPNTTDVLNLIHNAGYSLINYCGHGGSGGWGTTGFGNNEVAQITNTRQFPFIISVACSNGDFTNSTCFGEQWLRMEQAGQPVGAIATLMSTINQYWSEPMEGQEEMNSLITENLTHSKHSIGGIAMNGCMKMNDAYGQGGYDMTDTWTIFGDPSVVLRTETPTAMDVTHEPTIGIGSESIDIHCDMENAVVCLTIKGKIIGRGYVTAGVANILCEPLSVLDTILVTVTAYNKIPYFGEMIILAPEEGSFIIHGKNQIRDVTGNNNQIADFGEDILLDVSLRNIGLTDAVGVTAKITTTDPFITITNDSGTWNTIHADSSLWLNDAFAFTIADSIPDQHSVRFAVLASDAEGNSWHSEINIVLHAPVLRVGELTINDEAAGNGNGIPEAGETAEIKIQTINVGNASCDLTGYLTSSYSQMIIQQSEVAIGTIMPWDTLEAIFYVTIGEAAQTGDIADFAFETRSLPYSKSKNFLEMIGQFSENWETADFSRYSWLFDGKTPWTLNDSLVYEGTHAARSGVISHDEYSELSISMVVSFADSISFYRKVSSEKDWDWLGFFIDDAWQDQWSGEVDWGRVSYPVSEGMHTFRWRFWKDYVDYDPIGYDCGLVDYILFPPSTDLISSVTKYTPDGLPEQKLFPNPTTGTTTFRYFLDQKSVVSIRITDVYGNTVSSLKNGETQQAGSYDLTFDLSELSSGSYFVRLESEHQSMVRHLVLVR